MENTCLRLWARSLQDAHDFWVDAVLAEAEEDAALKASACREGWHENKIMAQKGVEHVGMRAAIYAASRSNVFRK